MMLDAPLAPEADADQRSGADAKARLAHHRRRRAPRAALARRPQALHAGALVGRAGNLRHAPPPRHELRALSEVGAARLPPRRLAGGRRPARLQPRADPRAVPRRLRRRVRHPGAARRHRPERGQPRPRRGHRLGRQRLAARVLHQAASRACAPAIVVPYEDGAGRGQGDRALRRRIRPTRRCSCSPAAPSRPATAATGRSTRPPRATACPSPCTCSAPAAIPTPAPAGRPTTWRRARAIPPPARPSSPASSSRACSSASRASRW